MKEWKNCGNCKNCTWRNGCGPFPEICIKCKYVETDNGKIPSNWEAMPMTNADRIRAMTNEELAELLEEMTYDSMEHRAEYWLRWLQQPAEGE